MGLSLVTTNGAIAGHQTKQFADQPCETSCNIHTVLPPAKSGRQESVLQNHWMFPPSFFARFLLGFVSLRQTCACLPDAITWVPNPDLASSFQFFILPFVTQNTKSTQEAPFPASSPFSLHLCPFSPAPLFSPSCFDLYDQLELLSSA